MAARRLIPTLLTILLLTGCDSGETLPPGPGELTIAAASSLRPVVDDLIAEWNGSNPDVPARATYGASGLLYAQINEQAPFDIVLSADDVYPRRLHSRGVVDEPFQFAEGRLAVWAGTATDPLQTLADLAEPRFAKIAIASPNLAPYGEAAIEALDGAGIYDETKDRLLFGGNVMEAAHYAESGGADAAIISLSLVKGTSLASRGTFLVIPAELHDPIRHEGAIVAGSPDREAAVRFVEMLRGPVGIELLEASGFETARPPAATIEGTADPEDPAE